MNVTPGALAELTLGRLRWDLLTPFPQQTPTQCQAGDEAVAMLDAVLADRVDGPTIDEYRHLPACVLDALRITALTRLQVDPAQGGLGLSDYNTFRVMIAAMDASPTVGFVLATHNGIGLPALLPTLEPGPLRGLVLRRLSEGVLSGWADTEPAGAGNSLPATRAVPVDGGDYILTGEKAFISNAAVADELIVSATTPRTQRACLLLVDTRSPGYQTVAAHELMGFKGLPLAAVRFDGLRVPAQRVIIGAAGHWRLSPLLEPISSRGRVYLLCAAGLSIARRCVGFQREFARRRRIDGRVLGGYETIQELIAVSLSEVFAIDSVLRWCLLGRGEDDLRLHHLERVAAKNLATRACWRVVNRTMSLLGAEGAEVSASKWRRDAPPLPVEQLFRDARMLLIAGGVDFAVDLWAGEALFRRGYMPGQRVMTDEVADAPDLKDIPAAAPGAGGIGHVVRLTQQAQRFAHACQALVCRYPDPAELFDHQRPIAAAGRIAGELFSMAVVLSRVTSEAAHCRELADVYCTATQARLTDAWRRLEQPDKAPYSRIAERWLRDAGAVEGLALGDRWLGEPARGAAL